MSSSLRRAPAVDAEAQQLVDLSSPCSAYELETYECDVASGAGHGTSQGGATQFAMTARQVAGSRSTLRATSTHQGGGSRSAQAAVRAQAATYAQEAPSARQSGVYYHRDPSVSEALRSLLNGVNCS